MSDSGRYGAAHLLIAFLAGAAAGAAVALLTAPQSGERTRERVQAWAADLRGTREALGRAARAARDAFAEALRDET